MDLSNVDVSSIVETTLQLMSTWGLRVVGAIALLIAGRLVAGWARSLVRRATERAQLDATLRPFIATMVYYSVLAVVLIAVLGMVGIQTASLIAVFGAAGLAVGLALQGTLSNFAAGVMLLLFRPFKVGDYIDAGGTAGSVRIIRLFVTTLDTPDNVEILVPNSEIWGSIIKNYASNPTRRNDMMVGISYDDDIGLAIKTIRDVLAGDDRVLAEPEPKVAVSELGDSSVNIVVRPWCKREDYWALRFDMMHRLKETLESAGCSIPYPQRDVHVFRDNEKAA